MRIKSIDELKHFGTATQKQVTLVLEKVNAEHKKLTRRSKSSKSRIDKITNNGCTISYCPWPSPDPAVRLHIALEKAYGRAGEGGAIVSEMIIPGHEIAFRYDWAHIHAKVVFEFDGFSAHWRLDDFNKDRQKQRHAIEHGWIPINITNRDVQTSLNPLMSQIDRIIKKRAKYKGKVKRKGFTQCIWVPS